MSGKERGKRADVGIVPYEDERGTSSGEDRPEWVGPSAELLIRPARRKRKDEGRETRIATGRMGPRNDRDEGERIDTAA